MMYMWARQYPVINAAEGAKVNKETAINLFQWLREVCSTKLLQTPILLGGPGNIVEVDESLFRHI